MATSLNRYIRLNATKKKCHRHNSHVLCNVVAFSDQGYAPRLCFFSLFLSILFLPGLKASRLILLASLSLPSSAPLDSPSLSLSFSFCFFFSTSLMASSVSSCLFMRSSTSFLRVFLSPNQISRPAVALQVMEQQRMTVVMAKGRCL